MSWIAMVAHERVCSLSQFWQMKNLARTSFQVSQDYFPETMAQLAIVNAPSSFTTIWSFIKPWLAKETVAKVDVLGSDYQSVLLDLIDADSLPTSLGGSCNCEEGCEKSNAGPWKEGRAERREKFLRGEGEAGVHVDKEVLNGGIRGTLEEDEEEREGRAERGSQHSRRSSKRSSKSAQSVRSSSLLSRPIDIPNSRTSEERDEEMEASSQSTQASTPGPSTPPLDISSEMTGLSISSSPEDKSEGVREEDITPTTPRKFNHAVRPETRTVQTGDLHAGPPVSVM